MPTTDAFMRESDAFSWYMETDPILRSTVVAVAWLDRSPEWDALAARIDRVTRLIPMFRQRLVEPATRLVHPRWTFDDGFDLSWHLRRVAAPAPHTADQVMDMARVAAMTGFDRARPLWEVTLVEGLQGGRAALVMKLHHSLTDGIGGMQLALLLFDRERQAPPMLPAPPAPDGERVDPAHLAAGSLAYDARRLAGIAGRRVATAAPSMVRTLLHPASVTREVFDTIASIARTVAPVRDTLSPVMRDRSLTRELRMLTLPMDDLRRAAKAAGGTINDGFMAGVTGGLRRYHERHGASIDQLRVTLPINIRTHDDPMGGNRITLIRFAVPAGEPDPATRIAHLHRLCHSARAERSLPHTNAVAGGLNTLPTTVVGAMLKHVDFVASDVPGFPFPVFLAGAKVTGYFPFGPTIGAALNTTLLTYDGICCIGVNIDSAAVPDADTLVDSLVAGFDEVLALTGDHQPVLATSFRA